jgi:tetratricopeptide (TPR) repeat protein
MTAEAMASAKQHFEDAIRRDPEFALAHIALADLYSWVGYLGYMRPKDAYSMGISYALRAVELDDTLAEAHAVLAEYHKQLDYNWLAAEREMAQALELSGGSPFVRLRHAVVVLMPQNRMDEAIAEIECALESDPLAGGTRFWLGIMLLLAQQYDRAIEVARGLLELEPTSPWPHFIIGVAYRQKYFEDSTGRRRWTVDPATGPDFVTEAVTEHLKAVELSPGSDVLLGWLGLALGVCGNKAEARAVLERLHRSERYILPTSFAHVHYGLGEFDAAFEWFDRAVEERDQIMMPLLSYAHLDPIRGDPRFAALLRKMKLQA